MMKNSALLFLLFICSFTLVAQENDLENQFNDVIKKSNNYQEYKVVKKTDLNSLKKNTLDTIVLLGKSIESTSEEIKTQKATISNLNKELETTKSDLAISKGKEEGIEVAGMMTTKSTYNTFAFSLIGILLLFIVILFFKFKNSNSTTKTTNIKLSETEEELETFRHKTIEREQQLRRKLQDEINKNKDS